MSTQSTSDFLKFANILTETYGIDTETLPQIISELMEFAEKMTITSSEKKSIVSDFIKKAISGSKLDDSIKNNFLLLIDNTIETIILASKLNIMSKNNNSKLNIKNITNIVYNRAYALINENGDVSQNVGLIALTLINIVEEYKHISGSQKKQVVMTIIKRLAADTDNSQLDLLATYSGAFIDTLVAAYKNKAIINEALKIYCKCLPCH
jgi:hypothetical protein